MTQNVPPPPPGFQIVDQAPPPPPPGFNLVQPAPTPAPAPPPAPVAAPADDNALLVDSIMDGAGYLAQKFTQGVTNLAGFPVDAVNMSPMLLNLLPGEQGMGPMTENPIGGSQSIRDALNTARDALTSSLGGTPGDLETDSRALEFVGRIAEEVGAAALPVAGGASQGLRLGVEGARQAQQAGSGLSRALGRNAERYAVAPGATISKELGMATAAGTGGATGQLLFDDGQEETSAFEATADLIGSIMGAGGFAGTVNAGKGIANVARAASGSDRFADQAARDAAASEMLRASGQLPNQNGAVDSTDLVRALRSPNPTADVVPGFQDSVADRTGNPGLAALEYSRQSGPNAGFFTQRRADNAAAATDAMSDLAPEQPPSTFRSALDRGAEARIDEADIASAAAQSDFEDAVAALQTAMSGEARGQTVRAALSDALTKARTVEREAWAGITGQVDPAPLAARFDNITAGLTQSEQRVVADARGAIDTPGNLMPGSDDPVVSAVLGPDGVPLPKAAAPVSEMQSLDEITTLRSEFTSAIREARAANDPNKARILEQFVTEIDAYLDEIPEISDALRNARAVSFDLNERFTRRGTPIADSLATTPTGGNSVPDSQVAGRFVQPDERQASSIDSVLRETDNAEDVRAALGDQIRAGAAPLLDKPDRLESFLGQYDQVFQKFPELREELGTVAGLRRTADTAAEAAADTTKALAPGGTSPTGKYRRFGAEDPARSMRTVIADDRPDEAVRQLLSVSGDTPEVREGLRSAFWSALEEKARPTTMSNRVTDGAGRVSDPWNFTTVTKLLEDPKFDAAARELYADNPEHLDNLKELAETLRAVDLRDTARARNSSGTAQAVQSQSNLPSTETLGAYSFAYQRGQIGLPFIALRVGATVARNAMKKGRASQFEAILDRALLDPEAAAVLLEEYNPANAEILSRWANSWAGAQAPEIIDLIQTAAPEEPDEDQALTDTIMGAGR